MRVASMGVEDIHSRVESGYVVGGQGLLVHHLRVKNFRAGYGNNLLLAFTINV